MQGAVSDAVLAARLASDAGSLLRRIRAETSLSSRSLGDLGDAMAQAFLAKEFSAARPGDAVLSEEGVDDPARLKARRVWIVDPLDGTREYSMGRCDWAVHVALWENGDLAAAAVSIPDLGIVLSTANPWLESTGALASEGTSTSGFARRRLRVAVSRSRPPAQARWLADGGDADLVAMGSAGYKAMAVVRGEVDAYVHAGGQHEWDSAAPVAVARAAGLHASRIDGSPLVYNQPDPWLPDLLICRPDDVSRILRVTSRSR